MAGRFPGRLAIRAQCLELAPDYAYAYLGMAEAAVTEGDSQKAADLARKAIEIDPNYVAARITAATALLRLGQPEEVIALLQSGSLPGTNGQALCLLGEAHLQLGQLDEALEKYDAALQANSNAALACNGKALVYARLGQQDKVKEFRRRYREMLLAARPATGRLQKNKRTDLDTMFETAAQFYTHAGRIWVSQGRTAEAQQQWLRAEALSSVDTESRIELARYYYATGKPKEALLRLEHLAKILPESAEVRLQIGEVQAKLGQLEASENAFREACKIAPNSARCNASLAAFFLRTNRELPQAVILARKAVELEPTAANYALSAAACHGIGDLPAASAAIEQAVKLDPQLTEYRRMMETIRKQSTR